MSRENIQIDAQTEQDKNLAHTVGDLLWDLGMGVLRVHAKGRMATAYFETAEECSFAKESVQDLFGDAFKIVPHPHMSKCSLTVKAV